MSPDLGDKICIMELSNLIGMAKSSSDLQKTVKLYWGSQALAGMIQDVQLRRQHASQAYVALGDYFQAQYSQGWKNRPLLLMVIENYEKAKQNGAYVSMKLWQAKLTKLTYDLSLSNLFWYGASFDDVWN